jgi:GDSL-like Lipase/Acylhydrolase family
MRKGAQVIALLLAYSVATWWLQGHVWIPGTLLTPQAARPLWRPLAGLSPPSRASAVAVMPTATPLAVPSASTSDDQPPSPGSWQGFVAKLNQLRAGRRDKVRLLHLGDSEVVGDGPTRIVRQQLAARFGSGGPGFGAAMAPVRWYQLAGWQHRQGQGANASSYPLGQPAGAAPGGGRYGPGGVAFELQAGGQGAVVLDHGYRGACTLRFHYDRRVDGGTIELTADRELIATLSTAGEPQLSVEVIERSACPRNLSLRTSGGYTRVYGWTVEYAEPGVTYSTVGVVGAQLRHLMHYEPGHLVASLKAHRPDLIVLGFGLNLASMSVPPPPSYDEDIAGVLATIRQGLPDAACMLVGPYPVGKPEGSHPEARNAARVTASQRRAAEQAGCAFIDRFHDAGGAPTAGRWRSTYPRILSGDYRHLTHHGSERMGQALAAALLHAADGTKVEPALFALGASG